MAIATRATEIKAAKATPTIAPVESDDGEAPTVDDGGLVVMAAGSVVVVDVEVTVVLVDVAVAKSPDLHRTWIG